MKKKYLHLLFVLTLLALLPTHTLARGATMTLTKPDGTKYTMEVSCESFYKIGTLYELYAQLTADVFGTISGVIVAFYDIEINVTITGDTYFVTQNTTLPDIDTEGGSSSKTLSFNLSDITDDEIHIMTVFQFKGNNTQGEDPDDYGGGLGVGEVRVKEASIDIIAPILAVLSIAIIALKKKKR